MTRSLLSSEAGMRGERVRGASREMRRDGTTGRTDKVRERDDGGVRTERGGVIRELREEGTIDDDDGGRREMTGGRDERT